MSDLFLGIDLDNIPDELKEKTIKAQAAWKRLKRAQSQTSLWEKELVLAQADLESTRNSQAEVLNRWNPETNTLIEREFARGSD